MDFDIREPVSCFLVVYSIATTLIGVVFTIIYLVKKRRRVRNGGQYSHVKNQPEDLQHLNRKSINNKYEIDSFAPTTRSLPIIPKKSNRPILSEYDSTTSTARLITETGEPPMVHHYEEMNHDRNENRQYDSILEHVVTALTTVYDSSSRNEEIYEKFMRQLINKIKVKHPRLYESIQTSEGMSGHMYEKVLEMEQPVVNTKSDHDSLDDSYYNKYIPPQNVEKHVAASTSNNLPRSTNAFGSTDHLKFIQESTSRPKVDDDPYLEAKRFTAKSGCPDELRKLCHEQDVLESGDEASTNSAAKEVRGSNEYNVSSLTASQSRPQADEVVSRSSFTNSEQFVQIQKQLERELSFKTPPEVPPKTRKTKLSKSDSYL